MRLLNTTTVQLKKFPAKEIPKYAILSHTWEADEVSLQDMSQPDHDVALSGKAGYEKIKTCCHLAQKDGYDWVWIDTCCIDKTSSSELSEEINSMYQWYKRACVCYAYLADLAAFTSDNTANKSGLWESRWFRRGWTLQELIAPEFVEFYAKDWSEIGTKSSLEPWIAEITGINVYVLRGVSPSVFSIFERMTWAKYRETTREEDMAYCLLGIFQINMPLLYGEGKKAFKRLQYELLQHHDDLTILAWPSYLPEIHEIHDFHDRDNPKEGLEVLARQPISFMNGHAHHCNTEGVIIERPTDFNWKSWTELSYEPLLDHDDSSSSAHDIRYRKSWAQASNTGIFDPPSITSRGLRITMFVKELPKRNNDSQLLAWTFCKMQRYLVCLKLKKEKSSWTRNENLYFVEADLLIDFHPMQLYLKLSEPEFQPEEGGNGLHVSYSLVVLGSDIFDDRDHSSKRCRMGLQHYCVTEAIGGQLEILEVSEYTTGNRGNCTRPWFHPCDIFEDLDHGHEWDCLRVKAINNEEDSPEEVVVVIGQQHRYTWRSNIWCGIQEETNGLALESIREAWYVKHQSTTFPQFFHDRARHTFKNGDVISVAVKRRYKDTDKAKRYLNVVTIDVMLSCNSGSKYH